MSTDETIARYLAIEAGNAAAGAATGAYGGCGWTPGHPGERIRRHLGTATRGVYSAETTEMTIAQERCHEHSETGGARSHCRIDEMATLAATSPAVGAEIVALAEGALGTMVTAATDTEHPLGEHVLCRLGELIATASGAAALCRRAAGAMAGELPAKADARFPADALATLSRVSARMAALKVGTEVLALTGAGPTEVRMNEIGAAQTEALADMDRAADAIYRSTCWRLGHRR